MPDGRDFNSDAKLYIASDSCKSCSVLFMENHCPTMIFSFGIECSRRGAGGAEEASLNDRAVPSNHGKEASSLLPPTFANFNTGKLPLAAPNREIRRRSVSQPRTCRRDAEKYCGSGIQAVHECADLSARNWRKISEALLRRDGLSNGGWSPAAGARVG